jgi:hypothetical protein
MNNRWIDVQHHRSDMLLLAVMTISTTRSETNYCLMTIFKLVMVSILLLLMSACATRSYQYQNTRSFPVQERAETQSQGGMSISASVPGEDETGAIFGVPIYQRGIQPVWIEVVNNTANRIRFAPTAIDRNYFSPLEVAYMHRKGFSKEARSQMDKRFHDSAMPRQIPAGETRSGYVFTHAAPGTKSFNIDLFSASSDYSFAFFLTPPGFVPDHARIDFLSLYSPSEIIKPDLAGARSALLEGPLTSMNRSGQLTGLPVGLVIVGDGLDVLKALLRAGWYESPRIKDPKQLEKAQYLFGRVPDAVFRIQRNKNTDRNKLNLWLAPIQLDGKEVWMAQLFHFIGQRTRLEQAILGARLDPNMDQGRDFFLQNMWYSQSLEQLAWLDTGKSIPVETPLRGFNGSEYFTNGKIVMVWLSGVPVSLLDTRILYGVPTPLIDTRVTD